MWQYKELSNGIVAEAKVYANPSMWGINEGRISKLNLYRPDGELFYEYDRGSIVGEVEDEIIEEVRGLWPG